jgi:hypothetical protein
LTSPSSLSPGVSEQQTPFTLAVQPPLNKAGYFLRNKFEKIPTSLIDEDFLYYKSLSFDESSSSDSETAEQTVFPFLASGRKESGRLEREKELWTERESGQISKEQDVEKEIEREEQEGEFDLEAIGKNQEEEDKRKEHELTDSSELVMEEDEAGESSGVEEVEEADESDESEDSSQQDEGGELETDHEVEEHGDEGKEKESMKGDTGASFSQSAKRGKKPRFWIKFLSPLELFWRLESWRWDRTVEKCLQNHFLRRTKQVSHSSWKRLSSAIGFFWLEMFNYVHESLLELSPYTFWLEVAGNKSAEVEQVAVELMITTSSEASCERGLSFLRHILSKRRRRLSMKKLTDCMRLKRDLAD